MASGFGCFRSTALAPPPSRSAARRVGELHWWEADSPQGPSPATPPSKEKRLLLLTRLTRHATSPLAVLTSSWRWTTSPC
ncbi:hypothetical protein BaRGS_00019240 [Batillaria attramentaria]|uniref:Uncharacterized protein n=1 Tax=Batillaria attramentaria TaxID=370345 RepID=A0ABD0KRL5_9CAEN